MATSQIYFTSVPILLLIFLLPKNFQILSVIKCQSKWLKLTFFLGKSKNVLPYPTVWHNVKIKSSPNYIKSCLKSDHCSFYFRDVFQNSPKSQETFRQLVLENMSPKAIKIAQSDHTACRRHAWFTFSNVSYFDVLCLSILFGFREFFIYILNVPATLFHNWPLKIVNFVTWRLTLWIIRKVPHVIKQLWL